MNNRKPFCTTPPGELKTGATIVGHMLSARIWFRNTVVRPPMKPLYTFMIALTQLARPSGEATRASPQRADSPTMAR